jgi:hypothetical protein
MAARNVRRSGDVDTSTDGLFLFNQFVADDPDVMLELWDYLAGWHAAETGLRTILVGQDAQAKGELCEGLHGTC